MSDEPTYYISHSFYKLDSKWRWMADLAKEESAREVENIIKNSGIRFRSYSTLGLRADADFMFWLAASSADEIQDAVSRLYLTVFGKYILPTMTYLSCTRTSIYTQVPRTLPVVAGDPPRKYAIVYPLTKTREWYLLPEDRRREMMDQHIRVGQKYPGILLNTTYSLGMHDEDFMLAFECDNLKEFQDLMMDLRETEVSRYVAVDTPMITCISKDIVPLISSLG
ncbi:conserved hypothetical protein [Cenarchaeum symbiosum A]|uniref:Chlorite dismutase n=1 Tax=Cenarchaeum symbiosum (strain A) TaxID=414004 RepID=A0RXH1_CENSY|nr:conserved hypothetical protein [Cenarchaeum symbiosum A]